MSATIPPERHNPKAWANYGCKDTIIFGEMQENGEKIDIFSLENGASAYSLEFRGEGILGGPPQVAEQLRGKRGES